MGIAFIAGSENIPVICLNNDAGCVIVTELFQLKTLSASDDSGNKIRHGFPFHCHPGFKPLDGIGRALRIDDTNSESNP